MAVRAMSAGAFGQISPVIPAGQRKGKRPGATKQGTEQSASKASSTMARGARTTPRRAFDVGRTADFPVDSSLQIAEGEARHAPAGFSHATVIVSFGTSDRVSGSLVAADVLSAAFRPERRFIFRTFGPMWRLAVRKPAWDDPDRVAVIIDPRGHLA